MDAVGCFISEAILTKLSAQLGSYKTLMLHAW